MLLKVAAALHTARWFSEERSFCMHVCFLSARKYVVPGYICALGGSWDFSKLSRSSGLNLGASKEEKESEKEILLKGLKHTRACNHLWFGP